MIRSTFLALMTTALLAGPLFAAGDKSEEEDPDVPLIDESMLPHTVTLPGSYVALPPALVTKIRNKILISRGEDPEEVDPDKKGGH
jgi:hypothetical protein